MGEIFSKYQEKIDPRVYPLIVSIPVAQTTDTRPGKVILKENESLFRGSFGAAFGSPPPDSDPGVLHTIKGIDGNNINVKVFRPPSSRVENPKKIPAIVYFHGGGMAIMNMEDYDGYYRLISSYGLVVIGVDFRNSTESPYPAGLHDCLSAVLWTSEHAQEFNIDPDRLIVGGESGGANLATATCLLAKSRGITIIKGQYLNCPYLCPDNRYKSRHKYGSSKDPNHMAHSYTNPKDFFNYLAWPCNATVEQLRGLPPTLLVVNQFDNLVSEGEAYSAKLMQAGVRVLGFRSLGTIHGISLASSVLPDLAHMVCEMIVVFVKSLGQNSKL